MPNYYKISRRSFLVGLVSMTQLRTIQAATDSCSPTARNPLGPFYRKGAPWTTELCLPSEAGKPLIVSGIVTEAGTCKPLSGAIVDVWQADDEGNYDNSLHKPKLGKYRLRGQMKTDEYGKYQFKTV